MISPKHCGEAARPVMLDGGVRHAIRLLSQEIARDMARLGVDMLAELGPDVPRPLGAQA